MQRRCRWLPRLEVVFVPGRQHMDVDSKHPDRLTLFPVGQVTMPHLAAVDDRYYAVAKNLELVAADAHGGPFIDPKASRLGVMGDRRQKPAMPSSLRKVGVHYNIGYKVHARGKVHAANERGIAASA